MGSKQKLLQFSFKTQEFKTDFEYEVKDNNLVFETKAGDVIKLKKP
jgi:hypothetical protein